MKTTLKVLALFAIFYSLVIIKGCFWRNQKTHCFYCNIIDFEVSTSWEESDTLPYDEISWGFDATKYWDCHEEICFLDKLNLINITYADDAEFIPEGQISSIEIYSNNDYDSLHSTNNNLNDIFICTLEEKKLSETFFPIESQKGIGFYILEDNPTDSLRLHKFTVIYKEIDGTIITKELPEVYIAAN